MSNRNKNVPVFDSYAPDYDALLDDIRLGLCSDHSLAAGIVRVLSIS